MKQFNELRRKMPPGEPEKAATQFVKQYGQMK